MIDTHCHFEVENEQEFLKECQEIQEAGVSKILVSCCTKEEIKRNVPLLKQDGFLFLALGYHPEEAGKVREEDLTDLETMIQENHALAIGEIGLDYHYTKEKKEEQIQLFESQLALAEKLNLPVVVHSRDATKDTIECLKKHAVIGVIHCFSGSLETAKEYIKMGFCLGIGGVVTFQNSNLKEVVKELPISSIVLETDSPYLAPVPFRGKRNSPKYLKEIAKQIALLKDLSYEEVEKETTKNARKIFDFPC